MYQYRLVIINFSIYRSAIVSELWETSGVWPLHDDIINHLTSITPFGQSSTHRHNNTVETRLSCQFQYRSISTVCGKINRVHLKQVQCILTQDFTLFIQITDMDDSRYPDMDSSTIHQSQQRPHNIPNNYSRLSVSFGCILNQSAYITTWQHQLLNNQMTIANTCISSHSCT